MPPGVLIALTLLMNTILPHPRSFMPGRYMRLRRTPLSTFTSKNRRQSSSGICSNGFGSKMPRLFTRMSTAGTVAPSNSAACGVARSPANLSTAALGTDPRISDRAADTDASVRRSPPADKRSGRASRSGGLPPARGRCPVEVLVEEDVVAPVRVVRVACEGAVTRPRPPLLRHEQRAQPLRELVRNALEVGQP